jgi:hypothetical protein
MAEKGFPLFLVNQMLSPWELGRDFEACGLPARLATVEELPAQLARPDTEALVMVNGSCWPDSAGQAITDFWRKGGSLVCTGTPLAHRVERSVLKGKPYWRDTGHQVLPEMEQAPFTQCQAAAVKGGILGLVEGAPFGLSQAELDVLAPMSWDSVVWGARAPELPVAKWRSGDAVTYPVAFVKHPDSAALDFWAGGNLAFDPTELGPATALKRVIVKGVAYLLKQRGSLDGTQYSSALAALERQLPMPAAPKPLALKVSTYPTALPCSFSKPSMIDALDLRGEGPEVRWLFACLQGILNRQGPRLYLVFDDQDETWRKWCYKRRYFKHFTRLASPEEALKKYRASFTGVALADELSRNAAICAAWEDKVLVTADEDVALRFGLPVKLDLRGRFSSRFEAQQWSFEQYFPKATRQLMCVRFPEAPYMYVDYLVQHKVFPFWLDSGQWGEEPLAELRFARNLYASYPAGIPILGWHAYGDPARGFQEYWGQQLAGGYGKYMLGNDFLTNSSFFSRLEVPAAELKQPAPGPLPMLDKSKVYFCFDVMDAGDAPWYPQKFMRALWDDENLGATPITWSFTPAFLDLAPAIASWYVANLPPGDELLSAVGGIGYVMYPYYGNALANQEEARRHFARISGQYAARMGMTSVALHMGGWPEPSDYSQAGLLAQYARDAKQFALLLPDLGRSDATTYASANFNLPGGTAVMHTLTRWEPHSTSAEIIARTSEVSAEARILAASIRKAAEEAGTRPLFINAYSLSWTTSPTVARQTCELLGPDYVPLSARNLARLWKQWQARP